MNFQTHFTEAHTALMRVQGSLMHGSVFHQANATIAALSTKMTAICTDLMQSMNVLTLAQAEAELNPTISAAPHMNATSSVCKSSLIISLSKSTATN